MDIGTIKILIAGMLMFMGLFIIGSVSMFFINIGASEALAYYVVAPVMATLLSAIVMWLLIGAG